MRRRFTSFMLVLIAAAIGWVLSSELDAQISGLHNFDAYLPPGVEVNDFHMEIAAVTDPVVGGSQIVNLYPSVPAWLKSAPQGWYVPPFPAASNPPHVDSPVAQLSGRSSTIVTYGGLASTATLDAATVPFLHFGIQLSSSALATFSDDLLGNLNKSCMNWTLDGQFVFEGGDPSLPIPVVVEAPNDPSVKIQIFAPTCGGSEGVWVGNVASNSLPRHVVLDELLGENVDVTGGDIIIPGATLLLPGESMTLADFESASIIGGDSLVLTYKRFSE